MGQVLLTRLLTIFLPAVLGAVGAMAATTLPVFYNALCQAAVENSEAAEQLQALPYQGER